MWQHEKIFHHVSIDETEDLGGVMMRQFVYDCVNCERNQRGRGNYASECNLMLYKIIVSWKCDVLLSLNFFISS